MLTINANNRCYFQSHVCTFILIITWILGLAIGYILCEPNYISLMRSAFQQPVSIVGLFVCIFLPLIASSYFIQLEKPIFVLIVCFIKSTAYGFSCSLISLVFPNASWLLRFLLLFSDSCFLLVLLFFWLKTFCNPKPLRFETARYYFLIGILVAFVDYSMVSHILEKLF